MRFRNLLSSILVAACILLMACSLSFSNTFNHCEETHGYIGHG